MENALRNLLGLSFIAGAALWACPEGCSRRVLRLLCASVLAAAILSPLREIDFDLLSLEEARFASAEAEITARAAETRDSLQMLLVRENCENYIVSRGKELGLEIVSASVELRRNEGGSWVPCAAEVNAAGDETEAERLRKMLTDELGIPTERQVWTLNE